MITIRPATRESRTRDRKRHRAVLVIGDRISVHLTQSELAALIRAGIQTAAVLAADNARDRLTR